MARKQISRTELARYLLSPSLFVMVILMVVEAMLAAATTWLVINAGRRVAIGEFLLTDLVWILTAQSTSYVAGVISWIFAERAGYRGFGKFMLRFARENRSKVKLLNDKPAREQVEPFLTGETFQCFFNVMYELEFALKLFLGLVFNALVLGAEIDAVGSAEADRACLSRKPAEEQPRHRARLYRLGQCFCRQQIQSSPVAIRLQVAAARGSHRPDTRHRGARGHERNEWYCQPRDRLRDHIGSRAAQCRQHGIAGRIGNDAAAADRDDLRTAFARQWLERFHRYLDALRWRRCQYVAGAGSGFRQAY
jgi:hypothetical protein